jgi:type II secretory ATPase GspE/PulE/Tfp pilus assembly ATPase PilB-like protein
MFLHGSYKDELRRYTEKVRDRELVTMHEDLLSALAEGSGLILVTGPTGHGKTTAIEAVLGDPRCPPNVIFIGDIRGEVQDAFHAVQLARTRVVVAVLRIPRATGAFVRLTDMGVPAGDLVAVVRTVFTTRLLRPGQSTPVLLHEQLRVTSSLGELVLADPSEDAVHRLAMKDGMRTLRQAGLEHVREGRLTHAAVVDATPDD